VRFIPVQLSQPDVPVVETNPGDSLHLPPATPAIQPPQASQILDALASGDDLDLSDLTDDGGEVSQIAYSVGLSRRPPNTVSPELPNCISLQKRGWIDAVGAVLVVTRLPQHQLARGGRAFKLLPNWLSLRSVCNSFQNELPAPTAS
jgi:hypothetical protein